MCLEAVRTPIVLSELGFVYWRILGGETIENTIQFGVILFRLQDKIVTTSDVGSHWNVSEDEFQIRLCRSRVGNQSSQAVQRSLRVANEPTNIVEAQLYKKIVGGVAAHHPSDQPLILGHLAAPDGEVQLVAKEAREGIGSVAAARER